MKNVLFLIITFIAISNNVFAQDNIVLKSGDEIKSKVLEINQTEIKYKKFDNQNGPTYIIPKANVFLIKYENGSKEIINEIGNQQNPKISEPTFNKPAQQNASTDLNSINTTTNQYEYWPHKRTFLLELEYLFGNNIDNSYKKIINSENNYLTNLGLKWVTKDATGNVLSTDDINKYTYSGAGMILGFRFLYYVSDKVAIGGRISNYSITQTLTVNSKDEQGTLISLSFFGPSINWHFYKNKRFGLLLKGDLSFVTGTEESLSALNLLATDDSFKDELPSGLAGDVKSAHNTTNFSGFQCNFGLSASYFISKWFNIDAGFQLNSLSGSFDKTLWVGSENSISSFSPVFCLSLNFLLRNKIENL